jgi:hypothetical protein
MTDPARADGTIDSRKVAALEAENRRLREALKYQPDIGELLHVYFRKFTDAPESGAVWQAIHDCPGEIWTEALKFAFEEHFRAAINAAMEAGDGD